MFRRSFMQGAAALIIAGSLPVFSAQAASVFTGAEPSIAINGYDPVGYFTEGKPVKGSSAHKSNWSGTNWHFANAENKAKFDSAPAKYAPKYGGFCAYAMAQGSKASTVPEAFSIVDGALYLNYSLGVRSRWIPDQKKYIAQADKHWPNIR